MSIKATTEPMYFPGSGTWKQVPINRGPGTPGIIDHYPEGPGETRPWEPPFSMGSRMPTIFGGMGPRIDERYGYIPGFDQEMVLRYPQARLPGQTGFEFGDGFALGTDPFGGGIMGKLAGQHPLWGGLGGLIGAGIKAFAKRRW